MSMQAGQNILLTHAQQEDAGCVQGAYNAAAVGGRLGGDAAGQQQAAKHALLHGQGPLRACRQRDLVCEM